MQSLPYRHHRAYQILDQHREGVGSMKDLDDLQMLSNYLYEMSNCGLGQTAGSPIKDIFNYFRAEVEAHIKLKGLPHWYLPDERTKALDTQLERVDHDQSEY